MSRIEIENEQLRYKTNRQLTEKKIQDIAEFLRQLFSYSRNKENNRAKTRAPCGQSGIAAKLRRSGKIKYSQYYKNRFTAESGVKRLSYMIMKKAVFMLRGRRKREN